jgi:hypothetical protein
MDYLTGLYEIVVLPSVEYDIANLEPLKSYTNIGNIFLGVGDQEPEYAKNQNIFGDISVFSNMTQLTTISVNPETRLSGSLTDLQNLQNLRELRLRGDQITGNTSLLKNFPNLEILEIVDTSITGTLSDISSMENLWELGIHGSVIEGDIEVISDMKDLLSISLGRNEKITGDTSALSNMTGLRWVFINDNGFSSAIKDFANCNKLESFNLWGPETVTGNLSDLGEKDELMYLWFESTVYTKPEDKDLFPNLVDYDHKIFLESTIDAEGSNLTYYKDDYESEIRIRTNKFPNSVVGVKVDGLDVPMADEDIQGYYHHWDDVPEGADQTGGWIVLQNAFLNTLTSGDHSFTLDIPQGGALSGTFTVIETANGTIAEEFPDAELAKAVAEATGLSVTDIARTDALRGISELYVDAVKDWKGLDKLTNLYAINVRPTVNYDISNLASLPQIQAVRFGDIWGADQTENQKIYGDISVLSNIIGLEEVRIGDGTKLTGSLSVLKGKDLRVIHICKQEGEGITGSLNDLAGMNQLNQIELRSDKITGTTSQLKQFSNLEFLILDNAEVTGTLSDMASLGKLLHLEIRGTDIGGDINALRDLDKLEYIGLGNNENLTGDTSDLSKMKALRSFDTNDTNISSTIKDFADFEKLETLNLWAQVTGKLSDLGSKEYLTELGVANSVYTRAEDKLLFPNLVNYNEDMFIASVLDTEGSCFEFNKDVIEDSISLRTNKRPNQIVAVLVDGKEVSMATEEVRGYYHDWDPPTEDGNYNSGCIVLQYGFLNTLSAGTHTFTLEIPFGGFIEGTFSVVDDSVTTWTVTFEDGSGNEIGKVVVADGGTVIAPAIPSKDGYTFIGWDKDLTNITGNMSVKAIFKINRYTVTFKDWNGTTISTQQVDQGSAAVEPQKPSREGFTFIGWDVSYANITADLTVTAEYTVNKYEVTFKDWDGSSLDTQTVTHGEAAVAPKSPSRIGYEFVGWDKDLTNIKADTTITAQYREILFTVTFEDEDGKVLKEQTVAYGKPATAPLDPTRQGYEFTGWDKGFASITADITITAKYHVISDGSYTINEPGTVDGTTLEEFGEIIIKSEGVTLIGGNLDGNVRVEAAKAVLQNLTIAGSVYLSAKDTTMTDSTVEGSLSALAESISLKNLKIGGNLSIGATDISLVGGTVGGNLTIERSVGNGRVEISGVTAKETIMYVRGGGSNSIVVTDSVFGAIVVDKQAEAGQEAVRVAVQGTTEVANTIVNNAAIIEDTTTEGKGIQSITLAEDIPEDTTVELRGAIKEVTVQKEDLKVVNNAAVEKLQVEVPSLTLVNNESVAELKLEKEAVETKVEGNKVETTNVATGGEEPVYIFIPGDPTGDGTVNIFDIMAVRNVIFGTAKLTGSAFTAADLDSNKDGILNIFDIMAIRNIIFG